MKLFAYVPRPALRSTEPPIQCVRSSLARRLGSQCVKLNTYVDLVQRLRIREYTPYCIIYVHTAVLIALPCMFKSADRITINIKRNLKEKCRRILLFIIISYCNWVFTRWQQFHTSRDTTIQ
jgi:hypothetical protein